jgi:hypothetical protein
LRATLLARHDCAESVCIRCHESGDQVDLTFQHDGLVTVDQDEDRVNWGDEIDVRAQLTVERVGRRLFGHCSVKVEWAQLRWLGEPSEAPF